MNRQAKEKIGMYSKIKLGRQSWVKIWFKKFEKFEFIGEMSEMSNVEKYNLYIKESMNYLEIRCTLNLRSQNKRMQY